MVMAQGGDKAAERRTPRYGVNVCMITKCPFIFIFSFSFSFLTVAEKMAFPWNFLPGFNMHGVWRDLLLKVQSTGASYCESTVPVTVYMLPLHVLATWNLRNLKILRKD